MVCICSGAKFCWLSTFLSSFHTSCFLLPRDAVHSADCTVARCLSVHLSSHAGILSKRLYISSNFFTVGYSHILVFLYQMVRLYSDGDDSDHLNECLKCKEGTKNRNFQPISRFSLYLRNDTRQSCTYGWPMVYQTAPFSMTFKQVFKVVPFFECRDISSVKIWRHLLQWGAVAAPRRASRGTCPGCKTLCPGCAPAVELQWRWP